MRARSIGPAMVVLVLVASAASAQIVSLDYSNDISWKAGSSLVGRSDVVDQTPPASAAEIDLGTLPTNANLIAFAVGSDGAPRFVLDTTVELPGYVLAGPRDVVRYSGGSYSVVLHGAAAGVPAGAKIDGLDVWDAGGKESFYLSFDVTVSLPGPVLADRRDVVEWTGSSWAKVFDGTTNGVPANLVVDALTLDRYDPAGPVFYLSFDGSGKLGATSFDDEDVVAWNGTSWSLTFDGSTQADPTFASGDLDALQARTPNVFRDGFESGNISQWSFAKP